MEFFNENTTNFFYNLLTEEMGIIRNVQHDAEVIGLKIRNAIKTTKSVPVNMDLTSLKIGEFYQEVTISPDKHKNVNKKQIKIEWQYFNFYDKETFLKYFGNVGKTKYNIVTNTLSVSFFSINGIIDEEILEGGIAHELTHNFQNQNRTMPLLPNEKVKKVYRNSDKNINSQIGLFKYIGIVIYLTYSFEQDAYLNAAYNYIMQKCGENNEFLYIYSQTEAYNSLHRMRNCLDLIEKALNDNDIKEKINQHCIKEYHISLEKIHKNGEKAYKRYARKLARMCGQAIKDVENKQIKEGWLTHTREFYNPFKMELTEMKKFDNTLKTLGF